MSRRQTWDLRLSSGNIKKDTTCPSCKDLLHIETRGFNAEDIEMRCGFKHIWVSPRDLPQNPYLLQRSEYPLRLQNNPLASTQAVHLPIKMIKAWLKICELSHKGCDANETAMSLYLIDVIAECIKFVPIARINYVALSYVWGNVECTKLNRENLDVLQIAGSLSSESHVATVPRTIRDAMRLTADLDVRYLWVDSLCLRQDDPLLNRYLNQMHNIYHNAYLTVVVANKDHADSGITGYETCPTGRKLPGLVVNYPNHVLGFTERDDNGASLERVDPDCLHPYLYIKAQRGEFSLSDNTEWEEEYESILEHSGRIAGTMTFDFRPPERWLDEVDVLCFVGIYCDSYRVKAICIGPVANRPNVFERLGVAEIWKDEWDSVAWYDQNIVLG
ncbi:unnamed protein product [Alternaria alternata]